MSYIDEIAKVIRREVPPHLIPEGDSTAHFRIYAVLALAKGRRVSLEDGHDAWSAWMSGNNPNHRSLKPLHQLDKETQADQPYLSAIHAIAGTCNLGR